MNSLKNKNFSINDLVPYFGVILVFAFFGVLTEGKIFGISSLMNLVNNGLAMLISSVAAVMVFARGDLDFSIGGIEGLCILLSGYVILTNSDNIVFAGLTCVVVGLTVGLLNGFIVNMLKIPSFVATISMDYILRGLIYTLIDMKEVSIPVAYARNYNVWISFIVFLGIAAITYVIMEHTKIGKVSKLYGENKTAVRFSGVRDKRYGIIAYAFLGIMVGIAAFLVTPRFTLVQATVGNTLAIDVLIACMIGGLDLNGGMKIKVSRPIIGSIIISVMNQGFALMNVPSQINQFTKGALFIIILAITSPNIISMFRRFIKREKSQAI